MSVSFSLTLILAQNKNKPHYEVEYQYWPAHDALY